MAFERLEAVSYVRCLKIGVTNVMVPGVVGDDLEQSGKCTDKMKISEMNGGEFSQKQAR